MSIAWFICPYKTKTVMGRPARYCAMDDFTQQIIYTEGGAWTESEVLGNVAIVKVRASDTTLTTVAQAAGFIRLPKSLLSEPLSSLTVQQKNIISNKLQAMGYTITELRDALGTDLGSKTLGDVLRFAAKRRLKPRYDQASGQIVLDGPEQPTRSIDDLNDTVN